jgi:hypothetical protein
MTRRLGRWLFPRSLVSSREEPVPHKLTREDVAGSLARFLASVILVVAIWSGLTFLGIKPIGKSPTAALVVALVFVVGMAIFGLRQELKGKIGIGWLGATITGAAVVSASVIASALGGH